MRTFFFKKHRVYGTLYFLIIPISAVIYYLVQGFDEAKLSFLDALYFSAVTITTLGYGDIQPIETQTRLLAATESLLGVLMIGLFLSALAHSRSIELAKDETDRSIAREKSLTITGVRKHKNLLIPLLDRYAHASDIISTKHGDPVTFLLSKFPISNFTELFDPAFIHTDDPYRPKIEIYFERQLELKNELERLLISIDLSYWPNLQSAAVNWLMYFRKYDYSKSILNMPEMKFGGRPMIEAHKDKLEKFEKSGEEILVRGSHGMDHYCALYLQLHKLNSLSAHIKSELISISGKI